MQPEENNQPDAHVLAQTQEQLDEWIGDLRGAIKHAIRNVESQRRESNGLPAYADKTPVYLSSPNDIAWGNWIVWQKRYGVDLEFIVSCVLDYFHKLRETTWPQRSREKCIMLGVGVGAATGVKMRRYIEEQVFRAYPNGENFRAMEVEQNPNPIPRPKLEDYDPEKFVETYSRLMRRAQRNVQREPQYKRNWRRPWNQPK